MSTAETQWRRCSACKGPIGVGALYWTCSVSTCNRKRTGLVFCTVSCWEVHLPIARHRDAWAEEQTALMQPAPSAANTVAAVVRRVPKRTIVSGPAPVIKPAEEVAAEVLVIGSRLKSYIRARFGFNASERVLGPLSDIVRRACDEAAENASRDGRKTVLDRDIPPR